MQFDTPSLLRATGEMFALFLRASPRFETYRTESAQLSLTGVPDPIMNPLVAVGRRLDDPTSRYCRLVRERDLPSFAFVVPRLDATFAAIADSTGFHKSGSAPFMARDAAVAVPPPHHFSISVATSDDDRADLLSVWERNTIPHVFFQRFGFGCLDHPDVTAFITRENGTAIATTTTTTVGPVVGIWGVHTVPEHRRRGAAIATVAQVLNHHRQLGAAAFLLYATPMGRPLYEKLGFVGTEEPSIWRRLPTGAQRGTENRM